MNNSFLFLFSFKIQYKNVEKYKFCTVFVHKILSFEINLMIPIIFLNILSLNIQFHSK